ncbi:MAG: glycosyl transferase family 2 [candidate division Zixibacteria bacterium HGW-Zixibacteria-1]|nr:MAG: glycosyl transferase family 2 [candidate division Zixibacteria bacterium HGW-Zixibacteria-1]
MIEISVVVPSYNEAANIPQNLERMAAALTITGQSFEIIAVDDGSTDDTAEKIRQYAAEDPRIRYAGYKLNAGRGKAIRTGIKAAQGRYILTIDCDLSYSEEYLTVMYRLLKDNPEVDFVIGSPYMHDGGTEDVPFKRLLISKLGNIILSSAMRGKIKTLTGILRGYKAEVVKRLDLESDKKEIHLEILSKALASGFVPLEFPAILRSRKKGKSKFRFKATALSHLVFSFFERPSLLFGLAGLMLIAAGLGIGMYMIYLWQTAALNPNRPLMTLMVLLLVAGLQVILFGFLGTQMVGLRREVYKLQNHQHKIEELIEKNRPESIAEVTSRRPNGDIYQDDYADQKTITDNH